MFRWVKRAPGGAEKIVPSETRESLMKGQKISLQISTSNKGNPENNIYIPASQEQVLRVLSVRREILQQVRIRGIRNCRTEILVALRKIHQIREPRGGIIQIRGVLTSC